MFSRFSVFSLMKKQEKNKQAGKKNKHEKKITWEEKISMKDISWS